jgi:glycosyltransferase involved in cell wall biosynthesis
MKKDKKRILFITSSLNLGGAERQLLLLCDELRSEFNVEIVSLDKDGPLLSRYQDSSHELKMIEPSYLGVLGDLFRLIKVLRQTKPDAVVTWLYEADILGGVATKLTSKSPIIWTARNSALPRFGYLKKLALLLLSKTIPDYVIANGRPAFKFHKSIGYPARKLMVIPNLIAPWTGHMKSSSKLLGQIRPIDQLRIGIASRQISGKGIIETIEALKSFPAHFPRIDLDIIGQTTSESMEWRRQGYYGNLEVKAVSSDADLSQWFGNLDLYLMPSTSWESQPNSLLEAIAVGCPILCSDRFQLDIELPLTSLFNPLDPNSLEQALTRIFEQSGNQVTELTSQMKSHILQLNNGTSIKKSWISLIEKAITKEKL